MIGFVTTKSKISRFFLAVLLIILLICTLIFKVSGSGDNGKIYYAAHHSVERIAFIENLGYLVNKNQTEVIKQVEIPNVFSATYEQYQQIQLQAGYDLKKYAGSKATLYTYNIVYKDRTDVYANLLVANDVIIGGDISALSVSDGFIKPLISTY